jgi:hypothetical protein
MTKLEQSIVITMDDIKELAPKQVVKNEEVLNIVHSEFKRMAEAKLIQIDKAVDAYVRDAQRTAEDAQHERSNIESLLAQEESYLLSMIKKETSSIQRMEKDLHRLVQDCTTTI